MILCYFLTVDHVFNSYESTSMFHFSMETGGRDSQIYQIIIELTNLLKRWGGYEEGREISASIPNHDTSQQESECTENVNKNHESTDVLDLKSRSEGEFEQMKILKKQMEMFDENKPIFQMNFGRKVDGLYLLIAVIQKTFIPANLIFSFYEPVSSELANCTILESDFDKLKVSFGEYAKNINPYFHKQDWINLLVRLFSVRWDQAQQTIAVLLDLERIDKLECYPFIPNPYTMNQDQENDAYNEILAIVIPAQAAFLQNEAERDKRKELDAEDDDSLDSSSALQTSKKRDEASVSSYTGKTVKRKGSKLPTAESAALVNQKSEGKKKKGEGKKQ